MKEIKVMTAAKLSLLILLAPAALVAQTMPDFVPIPREIHLTPTTKTVMSVDIRVPAGDADDAFAASDLRDVLSAHGTPSALGGLRITLLRMRDKTAQQEIANAHVAWEPVMEREGYVLISSEKGITIIGANAVGVFYGAQTTAQMLETHNITTGTIRDWPAMQWRGIDDDLSRGPFPTLEFQKKQIRTFARYKINLYSPYFEHTLFYSENPLAAPSGSRFTREDAKELVVYAAKFHILIVPEQEAFGHVHHMLKYEMYSDLAETPHGHVMAPGDPRVLPLIKSWFTQIAADYPSPFLHIGADETFELGLGRTKQEVDAKGLGPVYGDFLAQIHTTLAPLDRKLLFWGDVATSSPDAVRSIPKDMIAVPWIYSPKASYDGDILPFKNAGIETWVAPGDSNWGVVYPNATVAFENVAGFVSAGQKYGSTGMLDTVWNDDGEGLFNQDWYSLMFGAAAGWQQGRSDAAPYEQAFPVLFYGDATGKMAEAHREVMEAQKLLGTSNALFWVDPWSPMGKQLAARIPDIHEGRLHAEKAIVLIEQVRGSNAALRESDAIDGLELGARKLDFIGMKFQMADEMAHIYAKATVIHSDPTRSRELHTVLRGIYGTNGRCEDLRDGYATLKESYRKLWLSENKPDWLDSMLALYDLRIQLWQSRAEQIHDAVESRRDEKSWPSAQSMSIPVVQ